MSNERSNRTAHGLAVLLYLHTKALVQDMDAIHTDNPRAPEEHYESASDRLEVIVSTAQDLHERISPRPTKPGWSRNR